MKLSEGIYAYIWRGVFENNCNMYYFGEPYNILFDPGLAKYLDVRFEEMKKDGLDPNDVKLVVATHSHPDHFEGIQHFQDKGIPVAMHKDEIEFYETEGPRFCQMFGMPFPEVNFDHVLEDGTWDTGSGELEVLHTPGHSPGSVSVYWKDKKALACGDLVFEMSFGRVDFPGGDGKKLTESIRRIASMDIEYLMPGHMNCITGAENVKKNFHAVEQYFSML